MAIGIAMLELRALTKKFRSFTAVDGLDLSVPDGSFHGIFGPNGAGKTTTLRMLCGLLRPDGGDILWNGTSIRRDVTAWKRLIGVMPEDLGLFERLTFAENAAVCGRMYGLTPREAETRRDGLFEFLDLAECSGIQAIEGSQGMRKRLALSLALIHAPRVLLLDEPISGMDVVSARGVKDLFALLAERKVTVVITSHITDVLEDVVTRAAVIRRGKVVAEAAIDDIRRSHGTIEAFYLGAIGASRKEVPRFPWLG